MRIPRHVLAQFLPDDRTVREFESLFETVTPLEDSSPSTYEDRAAEVGAKANLAIAQLSRIADALELIASLPVSSPRNNALSCDSVAFREYGKYVDGVGVAGWNRDDGTLNIGLYGGSVLQAGQEIHYYAKNTSGATISNGTPVMFTGTVGASGKLTFGKAVADGSVNGNYMMGVATQDIASNDFGYVTSFGLVRGINTTGAPYGETWGDGDLLYFSPITAGAWTKTRPAAPAISVPVAVVINAGSGGSGAIFVRMDVSKSLNNLQDVYLNGGGPTGGQVLIYDASQSRWENHNLTEGTNISITNADGSITVATKSAITAGLTNNSGNLIDSATTLTNAAGASVAMLTNAPVAGNPTKWAIVNDNGVSRKVPMW